MEKFIALISYMMENINNIKVYNKHNEKETLNNKTNTIIKTKNERNSNFEVLRIVCMFLIVAHHLSCHGGIENISTESNYVYDFFIIGGKIGVDIFVLISAYFLVKSKFRLKKIFKIIGTVWLYSIILYFLSLLLTGTSFNWITFTKYLFPIIQENYWFMTSYCLLYFLSPMLNIIINDLNKTQHLLSIAFLITFYILFLVLLQKSIPSVFWFVILYFIGAFIRLYPNKIFDNNKIILPIVIISYLIILLCQMLWHLGLYGMDNVFVVINSIALFLLFKNIHIKTSKVLNFLGSTTFAVYIIHEHPALRDYIWGTALNCTHFASQPYFWLYAIFGIFAVYIISTLIACFMKLILYLIKLLYKKLLLYNNIYSHKNII